MPSFEIMDINGNTKEFDINKIKSAKDVAKAFKEFNLEVKSKKDNKKGDLKKWITH